MNKIGIGELKHAKVKAPDLKRSPRRVFHARPQNTGQAAKNQSKQSEEQKPREGQLAVDILQSEDKMLIICPIAGVEKADIKVAIQDDVLTIRGERKAPKQLKGKTALVNELYWGTFSRSIVLPDYIDRKNIQAKVHEHMLIITIPKTEDFKTRIIHINEDA